MKRRKSMGKDKETVRNEERWDLKQTVAELGISEPMGRKMVRLRQIPFYRVGTKIIFDAADVRAFRKRCRVEAMAS
jgi:excisionase family DNA binding protein